VVAFLKPELLFYAAGFFIGFVRLLLQQRQY
jgi:hypothetical protein